MEKGTYVSTTVTFVMASLPELGAALCIIILIVVLIAFFFIWMIFKFIIYCHRRGRGIDRRRLHPLGHHLRRLGLQS